MGPALYLEDEDEDGLRFYGITSYIHSARHGDTKMAVTLKGVWLFVYIFETNYLCLCVHGIA